MNRNVRVSRPMLACTRCRAAKFKCDGKISTCSACEKSSRSNECSSATNRFVKGTERNYVALLETRIEKLEKQIRHAKARQESRTVGLTNAAGPILLTRTSADPDLRRKEATDADNLVSDFGFL